MIAIIIGIDHGYYAIKTRQVSFPSGIIGYDYEPYTMQNVLQYQGKYYVCGTGRQTLVKNKTSNDNYYLLTLAAIAEEIKHRKAERKTEVILAVGLPLSSFGREKQGFREYLLRKEQPVRFLYESELYEITIKDNWEFGRETVAIRVSSYRNNGNLYVGLCHKEGREWEDFGDVTINLPYQFLEPNEAFITGDFTKDMLHFIKEHKLGKVLNETGRSGYATYQKVAFDLARLAEFDPEGVAEHCRFAGIEVPKEKPQKTKKQNRGEER